MTLQEFNQEFQFTYDAASEGGPDLNNYEKSQCLTQAVRDLIKSSYETYETSERSKRILAPLLKEHTSQITPFTDDLSNLNCYLVSHPQDLNYVLREEAKLKNCLFQPEIEVTDLDNLTKFLTSPFRKPNKRKIIRVEHDNSNFKIYSQVELEKYKIKYLRKARPIILTDFSTDPNLLGTETIEGTNIPTITELPYFVHDEIVRRAVVIAIRNTRENNLNSQLNT